MNYRNVKLKDLKYIDNVDLSTETPKVIRTFLKWYLKDVGSAIGIILLLIALVKVIAEKYNA